MPRRTSGSRSRSGSKAAAGSRKTLATTARSKAAARGRTSTRKPWIPRLPEDLLLRLRVHSRLEEWQSKRIVRAQGLAGTGKSTAFAANLMHSARHVFWHRISPSGGLSALSRALEEAGLIPGKTAADPEALAAQVLGRLESDPRGWDLVFDDLQNAGPGVMMVLRALAPEIPPRNTLYLASREKIALPIEKMSLNGQVADIDAGVLAFNLQELTALLDSIRAPLFAGGKPLPLEFTPEEVQILFQKSGGWPAGVARVIQFLRSEPGRTVADALSHMVGVREHWYAFLSQEVLGKLEPDLRDFVLRASVLRRMTPRLCNDILKRKDSARVLEELNRRNLILPVVPVAPDPELRRLALQSTDPADTATPLYKRGDSGPAPAWRFHDPFHEFLEEQLPACLDADELRVLLKRAAAALRREEAWSEAALCAAKAHDAGTALEMLEARGEKLIDQGHAEEVKAAFDLLGRNAYADRPRALIVLGRYHQLRGEPDRADALYLEAAALLKKPSKCRGEDAVFMGRFTVLRTQVMMNRGRWSDAAGLCREALAMPGLKDRTLRADVQSLLGCAEAEYIDRKRAGRTLELALAEYERAGDAIGVAITHYHLGAVIYYVMGEIALGVEHLRQAYAIFQQKGDYRRCCEVGAALGLAVFDLGDEGEARRISRSARRTAKAIGFAGIKAITDYSLARCALLRARPLGIGECFGEDAAAKAAKRGGNGRRAKASGAGARQGGIRTTPPADLGARKPELEQARVRLRRAYAYGDTCMDPELRVAPRIMLAEVELAAGDPDTARVRARQALKIAEDAKRGAMIAAALIVVGICDRGNGADDLLGLNGPNPHWLRAEPMLRKLNLFWDLHRLLMLRLRTGDVPPSRVRAVLVELIGGIIRLRHEALLLVHEPALGEFVLRLALEKGVKKSWAQDTLDRLLAARASAGAERASILPQPQPQPQPAAGRTGSVAGEAQHGLILPDAAIAAGVPAARNGKVPPLEIQTLGKLRIRSGEVVITLESHVSKTRALRLFVYLLTRVSERVPQRDVLKIFWPELKKQTARNRVYECVNALRKVLQPTLKNPAASCYVLTDGDSIRLEPGEGYLFDAQIYEHNLRTLKARLEQRVVRERDVQEAAQFRSPSAAKLAQRGRESDEVLIADILRVLGSETGTFLPEMTKESFVRKRRERLHTTWSHVLRKLLEILGEREQWEEIISLTRDALDRSHRSVGIHFHLITALYRSERWDEAQTACFRFRRMRRRNPKGDPKAMRELLAEVERALERKGKYRFTENWDG